MNDDVRLKRIAQEFEAVWAASEVPVIEDYLRRVALDERRDLASRLVRIDIQYRIKTDSKPKATDYLSLGKEFSELAAKLIRENEVTVIPAPLPDDFTLDHNTDRKNDIASNSRLANAWNCSSQSVQRCNMLIKKALSTGISNPAMS